MTFAIATLKFWMPVFVRALQDKTWEPVNVEHLTSTQRLWFDGGCLAQFGVQTAPCDQCVAAEPKA